VDNGHFDGFLYQARMSPATAARAMAAAMRLLIGDSSRLGTDGKCKVIPLSGENSRELNRLR
jgi:hypothetical protein